MQLARRWKKVMDFAKKWLAIEEKGDWLKDMRGNLAMVSTVIATMTFQVGLNPPGGVVQSGEKGIVDCPSLRHEWVPQHIQACPGQSVVGMAHYRSYFLFMLFNNISFFSSLIVCVWLISGLPLNHRFPTWFMATGMCVSLISLSLTYVHGVHMIMPLTIRFDTVTYLSREDTAFISLVLSQVVVGVVAFFLVLRFVLLFVVICTDERNNGPTSTPSETQANRS